MIYRGLSAISSGSVAALLALALSLCAPVASAGLYLGVAPTQFSIKASGGRTAPLAAGLSVGYEIDEHRIELGAMTGSKDDTLNQLSVEVVQVASLLYRYNSAPTNDFNIDIILGYSQVEIESDYPSVATVTDSLDGFSYGLGFEESFDNMRQLKLRAEYLQLYRSEDLTINTFTLGLRYVF